MAGIETVSKCPNCGKPALSKWESSPCGFMFDACPHCMFLYYTAFGSSPNADRVDVWQTILNASDSTLEELRASLVEHDAAQLDNPTFSYASAAEKEMVALTKLGGCNMYTFCRRLYDENYNRAKPSVRFYERVIKKEKEEAINRQTDEIPF